MSAIVNKVLGLNEQVKAGTDSYVDDIVVNCDLVSASQVEALLNKYGLECKPSVPLVGARVLGLRIFKDPSDADLKWKRDNQLDAPFEGMTKRQLFSFCGKLLGHFPVASWLRPACSYLKRRASDCGWDKIIQPEIYLLVDDLWKRMQASDPVGGFGK